MIEPYQGIWPTIDPSAYIHPTAVVIGNVLIGPEASIWPYAVLRGDDGAIRIGARTNIQDGSVIHTTNGISQVVVGEQVTVGHRVILHGCEVGDDCLIGMGSILLDNCVIEPECIIGAGALVPTNKRIARGNLVVGSPAKAARVLTVVDKSWIEHAWKRYVENARLYRSRESDSEPDRGV